MSADRDVPIQQVVPDAVQSSVGYCLQPNFLCLL